MNTFLGGKPSDADIATSSRDTLISPGTRVARIPRVPRTLHGARILHVARIMQFEWALMRAEGGQRLLVVLILLGTAYAAVSGRMAVDRIARATAGASSLDSSTLASLGQQVRARQSDTAMVAAFGDVRNPAYVGATAGRRWITLTPSPLAAFSVGHTDLGASYARVSMYSTQTLYTGDELDHPANLAEGHFDLAFVHTVLFPLLIIAFSFNLLSSERELGTLPLLLAQPMALRTLLLGKVLFRCVLVFAVIVAMTALAAILAQVAWRDQSAVVGLALWIVTASLYACFWVALAAFVNARGADSQSNLIALLSVWLLFVAVIPAVSAAVVTAWYPAPSRVALTQNEREQSRLLSARGGDVLSAFIAEHPDMAPASGAVSGIQAGLGALALQAAVDSATMPVRKQFAERLARRTAAASAMRFMSPASLVHDVFNRIAGTGSERFDALSTAANDYMLALRAFWAPRIASGARVTASDVGGMPTFVWRAEHIASTRTLIALACLELLSLNAALLVVVFGRVHTQANL